MPFLRGPWEPEWCRRARDEYYEHVAWLNKLEVRLARTPAGQGWLLRVKRVGVPDSGTLPGMSQPQQPQPQQDPNAPDQPAQQPDQAPQPQPGQPQQDPAQAPEQQPQPTTTQG